MGWDVDERGVLRWGAWTETPWLVHGFSTRKTGDFQRPGPEDAATRFGAEGCELITVHQVHGERVRSTYEVQDETQGDALVTDQPGELIGVRTADCLPILLLDRENKAVAAVHAGWRGAAANIAGLALERMELDFGTDPKKVEALLGPCIGVERYEVGSDVAEQFPPEAMREFQGNPRPFLDLTAAARMQLQDAGVQARAIQTAAMCTFDEEEKFFSHRRGKDAGRMLSVIGLRDNS